MTKDGRYRIRPRTSCSTRFIVDSCSIRGCATLCAVRPARRSRRVLPVEADETQRNVSRTVPTNDHDDDIDAAACGGGAMSSGVSKSPSTASEAAWVLFVEEAVIEVASDGLNGSSNAAVSARLRR